MSTSDTMVSVLCTVYNHEHYIRKCLDGFVMQKTDFKFEVIIHDDASTDNTASIIREYEQKYPDIIKPIYQKENQYSKGIGIYKNHILPVSNGKYLAICEGDDFWTDPLKLQKQFDALESHPECKLCVALVHAVNEKGEMIDKVYPPCELKTSSLTPDEFLKIACKQYSFQTSSYFLTKEEYLKCLTNPPEFARKTYLGDWPIQLYFSQLGNVYYIEDEMSCYRINSVGSFSERVSKSNNKKQMDYYKSMIDMMEKFDEYSNYKHHESCNTFINRHNGYYYHCLISEKRYKEALNKKYRSFFKQESKKDRIMIWMTAHFPFVAKIYSKIKHK